MGNATVRLQLQAQSLNAGILAAVTAIGGMIVGLGIISPDQEGIIVATTTGVLGAAGLVANAIHTGQIEPSAIVTSIGAVVVQAVALVVSFAWISNETAGTVIAVSTAVVLAVAQVAHALISKKMLGTPRVTLETAGVSTVTTKDAA